MPSTDNNNNNNNNNNKQEWTEQAFDDIERGNNAHVDNDLWEAADAYGAASNLLRRLSSSLLTTSDEEEEEKEKEDRIKALYQHQYVQYLKKGREALVAVLTEELSQQHEKEDGGGVVVSLEERERRTKIFTRLYAFKEVEEEEKEESLHRSIEHRLSKLYIMQDDDNDNNNDTNDEKEEHPKSKQDQQASIHARLDLLKQSHGPIAGRDDDLKERLGRLGVTVPKTNHRRDYNEAPLSSNVQDDVDLIIAHAKDEARLEEEDRYASQDFDTSGDDNVQTVSDDDDITTALIDNQLDKDEGFKSMPNENDSAHDDKEEGEDANFDQDVEQLIASVQKQEEEESNANLTLNQSEVMTAKQPILSDEVVSGGSDKELANILVEAEQWQDVNDDEIQEEEDHHDGGGEHAKLLHLIVQTRRLLLDAGDCLQITKDPKQQQEDDNEPNMDDANTTDDTKMMNDNDDGVKHGKQILLEAKQKLEQIIAAMD